MNRFWCPLFADWLERNSMDCLFHKHNKQSLKSHVQNIIDLAIIIFQSKKRPITDMHSSRMRTAACWLSSERGVLPLGQRGVCLPHGIVGRQSSLWTDKHELKQYLPTTTLADSTKHQVKSYIRVTHWLNTKKCWNWIKTYYCCGTSKGGVGVEKNGGTNNTFKG